MYKDKSFALVVVAVAAFSFMYAAVFVSKQSGFANESILTKNQTAALVCTGCYFVSPTGSDSASGSESSPFKTIARGVNALNAGGTLYLRGGTYHEQVLVTKSGTVSAPITIASYPQEEAVIDGQMTLPAGGTFRNYSALFKVDGSYIVLKGIKITGSAGMGLVITGSYNLVDGVKVHRNNENGILVTGSGTKNTVQNSEVWYNAMSNENYKCTTSTCFSWPSGLSAARAPSYTTFRNNIVWENWGEGMSSYEADHTLMEGNQVFNNKDNVYLSDTRYSTLNRNIIYSTYRNPLSPELFPESIQDKTAQNGIMMGDETSNNPSTDNIVTNNLVYGNYKNFNYWGSLTSRGLVNVTIAYNTFIDSGINGESSGANIAMGPGAGVTSSNSRFENNIILQQSNPRITTFTNLTGIAFANNVWNISPGGGMSGAGDVVADPNIARTGSTAGGVLSGEYFKILSTSPAKDVGTQIRVNVSQDYFGTQRPQGIASDRGGHEYTQTSALDILAPTVSVTLPVSSSTVSGIVTIAATASDNVGVSSVTFKVGNTILGSDSIAPYSVLWNTASYPDGVVVVEAIAKDAAQNSSSSFVSVAVSNAISERVDIYPPSVPASLTAKAVSASQVDLSWSPSADPVIPGYNTSGLVGYRVYRNGFLLSNVTNSTTFQNNSGLSPNTSYTYAVSAYDADGNESLKTPEVSVLTPSVTTTGLQIGDMVQVTAKLKVRATASNKGTMLGIQPQGAKGTILNGPAYANGYTWWNVDFDNSTIDGWSAGNWLVEIQ